MKRALIGLVVLLLLVGGVAAGWYLVGQKQLFGKKAAVSGGTAQIRLSPETNSAQAGSSFPVSILFSTGSTPISAITVQLDYDYTGPQPPLSVSNIALDSNLLGTGEWSVPIKTFTADNGHARVRIAAINTSLNGFTSISDVQLATLTFLANSLGTINVTFDPTESKVTTKAGGTDVLLVPTSTGTYTVLGVPSVTPEPTSGGMAVSATPTPASAPGPTSTPSPASAPGPTSTPGSGGTGGSGETGAMTPTPTVSELPKSGMGDVTVGIVGIGILFIVIGALTGFVI